LLRSEEAVQYDGLSVIVSRRKCALVSQKEKNRRGESDLPYSVNQHRCRKTYIDRRREGDANARMRAPQGTIYRPFLISYDKKSIESATYHHARKPAALFSWQGLFIIPCEAHCGRARIDEPIAVHTIERFLGDYGADLPLAAKGRRKKEG